MSTPQRLLNKWQFVHSLSTDYRYMREGWKVCQIGIFKLTSFPREGVIPDRKHYKGFLLRFKIWFPVDKF